MQKLIRLSEMLFVVVLVLIVTTSMLSAQPWGDGSYHRGMHRMIWGGQLQSVTAEGNVILDSVAFPGNMDSSKSHYLYFIDSAGNGVRHYQLFFGPYWYTPASGAERPRNGQPVVVRGGLLPDATPPVVAVYWINGLAWRDSAGAPPWGGRWIHRSAMDSASVYAMGDSTSWMTFPPGSMGSGMMGGGMMQWPDSMFADFERMAPDSLPFMARGTAVDGFHLGLYAPGGILMIPGSMTGGFGVINMANPMQIHVYLHPDTLQHHGLTMNRMRLMFLDVDSTWQEVLNQTRDSATSSITANPPNAREYYALTGDAATGIESDGASTPTQFALEQNYPNPFNPGTSIKYSVGVAGPALRVRAPQAPRDSRSPEVSGAETLGPEDRSGQGQVASVKLVVYDLVGREVAVLVNERQEPGNYQVNFDGSRLASGIYYYRLTAGSFVQTRAMTLLK